jgi:signal transduction histidine kinase
MSVRQAGDSWIRRCADARPPDLIYRRPMRRYALDVAISVGVLVLGLAEVVGGSGYQLRGAWIVGVVITAVALFFRRRAPLPVLVVVLALVGSLSATDPPQDATYWFFASIVATHAVGAYTPLRQAVAGLGLVLGLFTVGAIVDDETVGDVIFVWILFAGVWALGRLLERRTNEAATHERRAAALEEEREERARAAIAEERARIARELHDIVAHGVSTMVLQVGGVRRRLTDDQAAELAALLNVEETGRRSLVEMHRMLGIMRQADEGDLLTPQPGLGRLDELADSMRAAGLPVELCTEGEPFELPSGLDLSAFRIIQEALTNTLKHAGPARASVTLTYRPDSLELEVLDDGAGSANGDGAGHGLLGMRERVALFGGRLDAGARANGGYRVRAHLPL